MRAVVVGAGQVGSGVAAALAARGVSVRVLRRGNKPVAGAAEVLAGDARDPAFVTGACAGSELVFHCANPSAYTSDAWESEFPALGEALIAGATSAGAKLVCLDNLYAYGEAGVRTEETPRSAAGRKGRVRTAWEARLRAAPGLRWVAGRAGDFFGPGTEGQSLFSRERVAGLAEGRAPWLVGDPSAPHAFSFVPDVVAGLVALGTSDAEGVWHLPVLEVPPAELVARIAAAHGRDVRARTAPAWSLRLGAWFVPLLRELQETMYQWDRPFRVSDARFRARFPGLATPLDAAVSRTAREAIADAAVRT